MPKTLKQVMKKLNKEKYDGNVYVGGKYGSGFFYIGPYDKNVIQKKYDELDLVIRAACDETINSLKNLMYGGIAGRVIKEKEKDLEKTKKLKKELAIEKNKIAPSDEVIEKLEKAIKQLTRSDLEIELAIVDEMARMSSRIKRYEYYKNHSYKDDVEDVTVVETYPKTDPNEEGIIIILDGCQMGKYWILSEVEKAS